jgi:hypothetical protein
MNLQRAVAITGRDPQTFDCTGLDPETLHAAWTMVSGLTHIGPKAATITALTKHGYLSVPPATLAGCAVSDKPLKGKPKWLK